MKNKFYIKPGHDQHIRDTFKTWSNIIAIAIGCDANYAPDAKCAVCKMCISQNVQFAKCAVFKTALLNLALLKMSNSQNVIDARNKYLYVLPTFSCSGSDCLCVSLNVCKRNTDTGIIPRPEKLKKKKWLRVLL